MFTKPYWINVVTINEDGSTTVTIEYLHKQTGTPTQATVTGVTGTFVSATSETSQDTADFNTVDLLFTGTVTIDPAYCKNETYFRAS